MVRISVTRTGMALARNGISSREVDGDRQCRPLTLKQLQRGGFVERTSYPEVPPRVEYTLTELGSSLLSAVLALGTWSTEHQARIRGNQAAFDAVESQEAEKP
ncbi:helix-turn-helix domain-containing protein [Amycolatopsis sp. NPDC051372]|uniref:winged helix-turn-helix transcriptional regulator n=1 Tax=unclassified Amycolatopsis TaxID=2618356 RepID=UPI00342F1816